MSSGKKTLIYKKQEYNFIPLIEYFYDENLISFKQGDVIDKLSGEVFDISDIFLKYKEDIYFMLKSSSNFSSYSQQARIKSIYTNQMKNLKIKEYERKLVNDVITLEEIEDWLTVMPRGQRVHFCVAKYEDDIIVNGAKPKPKEISRTDYSRFFELIYFMNYRNELKYDNGKTICRKELSNMLDFKEPKSFDKFINNLKKYNMIIKTEKNTEGISFLIINPVYAMRKMKIDFTTYTYFKSDLDSVLTPLEKKYLELKGKSNKSDTMLLQIKE